MPGRRQTRRFRKRTFVVTGISLLCVALAGGVIVFLASLNLGPSDLVRISLSESDNRNAILGSGVSLSEVRTANLLEDPSFEPYIFRQALTVFHGDESNIVVSSEDAASGYYGDGFFAGANARIMTWTDEGMVLKKTARVSSFGINRVGVFQEVLLPGDIPANSVIRGFAHRGQITVAVGDNGLILRIDDGQTPEIIDAGLRSNLTDISSGAGGFWACSNEGEVLFSTDGLNWVVFDGLVGNALVSVAGSDSGVFAAVDSAGNIYSGTDKIQTKAYYQSGSRINEIICSDNLFIAIGDAGLILTSANGIVWQNEAVADNDWLTADYLPGKVIIGGENGSLAVRSEENFVLQESTTDLDFVDIILLSQQQFIALDTQGRFHVSNDGGHTWDKSEIDPGMHSRIFSLAGKDRIISADENGSIGLAQLVAEFGMDSPLREGRYRAGDLLYLEKTEQEVPDALLRMADQNEYNAEFWEFYGADNVSRTMEQSAPGGGKGSIVIDSTAGENSTPVIISQKIDSKKIIDIETNEIFEMEFWLRHEGPGELEIQAWLSGVYTPVGTTIDHVGGNWKKHSYAFVFPKAPAGEEPSIFFNIAYSGQGKLWIDRMFLGPASASTGETAAADAKIIEKIKPAVLRLDFLPIGKAAGGNENWSLPMGNDNIYWRNNRWQSVSGHSLHAGLQLSLDGNSDPWLILDSYISEAELLHLIEYLSAPISEHYGRLRQQNGSVIPWTDQFNRIYLEFCDNYSLFLNDRNRANFVDLMISTVTRSPYYQQLKNQLIFVDGMYYEEGVMLSKADYHATDLSGNITQDSRSAIEQAYTEYYDQVPRNLEKPASAWTELIRAAGLHGSVSKQPTLADLTFFLLADLGKQTSLANLSLPDRNGNNWQEIWPAAAQIAAAGARGEPLNIEYYAPDLEINEPYSKDLSGFAFRSREQISVILTNQSEDMITCELLTDIHLRGAEITQYDSEGLLLSRQTFRRQESRINLLPGGVTKIIRRELSP